MASQKDRFSAGCWEPWLEPWRLCFSYTSAEVVVAPPEEEEESLSPRAAAAAGSSSAEGGDTHSPSSGSSRGRSMSEKQKANLQVTTDSHRSPHVRREGERKRIFRAIYVYIQMVFLPRQARDKRRESSTQKQTVFSQAARPAASTTRCENKSAPWVPLVFDVKMPSFCQDRLGTNLARDDIDGCLLAGLARDDGGSDSALRRGGLHPQRGELKRSF